jgi:hypothetical protein
MSAQTVEATLSAQDLDDAQVGATFLLDNQAPPWIKQADGRWLREEAPPGASLSARYFVGYLASGRIVLTHDPDEESVTDLPDLHTQPADPLPVVERVVERIPEEFKADLLAVASSIEESELDTVLEKWGMTRTETVTVTVTVTGFTYWVPSIDAAATGMVDILRGAEVTDVDETVQVRWRKRIQVEREVSAGDCACQDVKQDDDDVEALLPTDFDEVSDWEPDCSNC